MNAWFRTGMLVSALTLAACGSSPKSNFYTLADGVQPISGKAQGVSVAVMPVNVPDLVDKPQMVVRLPGSRVQVLEQQRWADPLRQEISRRIATDLGRSLGSSRVVALPEDVQALDPDFRVTLEVQRFDSSTTEGAGVDVVWRIAARDGKIRQGRSAVVEPLEASGDSPYAGLVAAHKRAFARVTDDIATAIKEIEGPAR